MHWLTALVLALVVLVPAGPGGVYAAEPLIARGGAPGDGWVALTIRSNGAPASAGVGGYLTKLRPIVFATYLYDAQGAAQGGITTFFGDSGSSGRRVYVDANAADQNLHFESHEEFDSNSYGGMGVTVQGQGVATLVLIAAGEPAHWTWTLEGGPGVSLERVATGDRAFRFVERDFQGSANVGVWNQVGAHAAAEVSRSFEVADTWIGGFFGFDTDLLSLSTPTGERTCPCSMLWFDGPDRAGPGIYTGRFSGVGPGNVFLWGADAHLPEPGTLLVFSAGSPGVVDPSEPVSLQARLTDADVEPLADAEVEFEIGAGEPVTARVTTDTQGLAQATMNAPSQAGFYLVTAWFDGLEDGREATSASMILEVAA